MSIFNNGAIMLEYILLDIHTRTCGATNAILRGIRQVGLQDRSLKDVMHCQRLVRTSIVVFLRGPYIDAGRKPSEIK